MRPPAQRALWLGEIAEFGIKEDRIQETKGRRRRTKDGRRETKGVN